MLLEPAFKSRNSQVKHLTTAAKYVRLEMGGADTDCFGVVIDAGSSGSRVYVFKWHDPKSLLKTTDDQQLLQSVPQIIQERGWTSKVTPGLSSFRNKPHKAFSKHIKPLLEFASEIIPKEKLHRTPVFIQATAGMRLLQKNERDNIIENLCDGIKYSTDFLLANCASQIQVIDGEIEGLYGWLGLNYLHGHFNGYDAAKEDHFTFGFMDMGGASTQIAFAPSNPAEVEKHEDDIATIYLRSVNGDIQEWNVFVSTWLGFGANEARRRYLVQLINGLPENSNNNDDDDYSTKKITDPCVPKNCQTKFAYMDNEFDVYGSGNYEQCSKSIYPLLLKNLPCIEEPCLFNGVHAPQIDYFKDKFIGTSEYWYTANDVFKLGGTYNFEEFSTSVKEFCNTDWKTIKSNSEKGFYNSIPVEFLIDSCFKANWVLNVLHEGFDLPRAGIDNIKTDTEDDMHPLFQSADSVKEKELSWTLGKILLYACGNIEAGGQDITVGVKPSDNSVLNINFLSGSIIDGTNTNNLIFKPVTLFVFFAIVMIWHKLFGRPSKRACYRLINIMKLKIKKIKYLSTAPDPQSELEQGTFEDNSNDNTFNTCRDGFKFRSKSMFNLNIPAIRDAAKHPMRSIEKFASGNPCPDVLSSSLPNSSRILRPAFSLADFSKFQDDKFND